MAAAVDMGEVEEIHSKEDNIKDGIILNGEISSSKVDVDENSLSDASDDEVMEVDGDQESDDNEMEVNSIEIEDEESNDSSVIENVDDNSSQNDNQANGIEIHTIDNSDDEEDEVEVEEEEEEEDEDEDEIDGTNEEVLEEEKDEDVHVISENENEEDELQEDSEGNKGTVNDSSSVETDKTNEGMIVLNDSGDGDIEIIESNIPKENGSSHSPSGGKEESNAIEVAIEVEDDVINLDTPIKKYKKHALLAHLDSPRRSARNLSRQTSYKESDKDESNSEGEESDIEEVLPQDPLAETDSMHHTVKSVGRIKKKLLKPSISSTIVVKDTKRLVEIASKSSSNNSGKKEPTLVIIDTNSILSGRGPIPINQKQPTISQPFPVLPMAVPAQGLYPPNMRATITPIPMHNSSTHSKSTSLLQSSQSKTLPTILTPSSLSLSTLPTHLPSAASIAQSLSTGSIQPPPILPSLTDDMFVVEAPSFIVPYVYEKPPVKDLKEFLDNFANEIAQILKSDLEEKAKAQKEIESVKESEAEKAEETKRAEEGQQTIENDTAEGTKTEGKEPEDFGENSKEKKDEDDQISEIDEEETSDKNNKNEEKVDKNTPKEVEITEVEQSIKSGKETSDKLNEALLKSKVDEQEKCKAAEQDDKTKIIDLDKLEKDKAMSFEEMIRKPYSYFDSPLGKFFMDIGHSLVQEYVQTDLLKQQKRKREREGGKNIETNKTITSLIKNLEYSKENNGPYHMPVKKCDFCSFKTESALAMSFHLETPHMKNFVYRCNFCSYEVRSPHDILFHMEAEHTVRGRLERAPAFHQCPNCPFEDNQKGKLSRHLVACTRKFKPERNLEPPIDWEPPAKIPRVPRMKQSNLTNTAAMYQAMAKNSQYHMMQKMQNAQSALNRGRGRPSLNSIKQPPIMRTPAGMVYKQSMSGGSVLLPTNYQLSGNQLYQVVGGQEMGSRIGTGGPMTLLPNISSATSALTIQQPTSASKSKSVHQPSISITPLPRNSSAPMPVTKPGDSSAKNSFVICEICDGYIKDLEQLRNHMQWIHKVKIHPKMIYNRPPLNCQKCQFRFFTDQGLERHLLGSHGLVTSSMQEAANKSKDAGRCPVCGRVYQWKLLNHVARDHNMTLKPAHLSYKCTVCTATFGMYKQFENHVYSAHSVVAKRVMDKKSSSPNTSISSAKNDSLLKPLKINDEITIIPQLPKASAGVSISKESSPTTTLAKNSISVTTTPSTSKSGDLNSSMTRAERLARRKTSSGANK